MVGVCHERWTVKPSRTKRLITPGNESPDSSEWGSHDSGVNEGGSAGGGGDGVSASLGYICRPSHRQPPHSGESARGVNPVISAELILETVLFRWV